MVQVKIVRFCAHGQSLLIINVNYKYVILQANLLVPNPTVPLPKKIPQWQMNC